MDEKASTPRRLRVPEGAGDGRAGPAVPPEPDPESWRRRRGVGAGEGGAGERPAAGCWTASARLVIDVQGKVAGLLGLRASTARGREERGDGAGRGRGRVRAFSLPRLTFYR